ncbi:hypothetical protein TruAng_002856 [Truncatella angustata]|nr:hypothetical protein TruAng_002856 [Truncatella angustata]
MLLSQSEQDLARAQQAAVLHMLKFRSVHDERFESVTKAHNATFNWLLANENTANSVDGTCKHLDKNLVQAKQQFVQWLEAGEDFFYIAGKPGAGKSTLMKFICSHINFCRHLRVWAAGSALLVGRFFFWKPGQPEQKSINGLLRGLLYSILESSPDITTTAFPELCEGLRSNRLGPNPIQDQDVERAFENILAKSKVTNRHKVVLVIDGLDEFEGNHADLLVILKAWATNYRPIIKICVSSREYGIFEEFFSGYPKLRLHELTCDDMAQMITCWQTREELFSSSTCEEAKLIKDLMIKQAEGVFLWVIMVIATIEDALLSRDITNASEIRRKIRLCPSELDDLFPHLLQSVTANHRTWVYRAISLVRFAQFQVPGLLRSSQAYHGVGLLDLMLLDEASPTWNLSTFQPRSDTKALDIQLRLENARKRIISHCKGFLSIASIAEATLWPANGDERMYAALTHRSIVEFLSSDTALSQMSTYLADFDPFFALFSTVLACLRFLPPSHYPLLKPKQDIPQRECLELIDILEDTLQTRLKELIRCGALLGLSGSPRFLSLIDAIGDAIKRHLTIQLAIQEVRLPVTSRSPHEVLVTLTLRERIYEYSEWRRRRAVPGAETPIMTHHMFEAFLNVIRYFHLNDYERANHSQANDTKKPKRPRDWIRWNWLNETSGLTLDVFSKLLAEFFANGIDLNWIPNKNPASVSWKGSKTIDKVPWTCWQTLLWAMLMYEIPCVQKYAKVVDLLLRQGADPNIQISVVGPLKSLKFGRPEPHEGWYLLMPYMKSRELAESLVRSGLTCDHDLVTRRDLDYIPTALIQESAPIYQCAKDRGWLISLRDILALCFPQEAGYFSDLLDSLDNNEDTPVQKTESPPLPLDYVVGCDTGVLGTSRGHSNLTSGLQGIQKYNVGYDAMRLREFLPRYDVWSQSNFELF